MAVLEKIRVKLGILITVLIAVALLSFIIDPQTLTSTAQRFSSDNKVGVLDGKSISYIDFYQEVDYFTRLTEMMGQSSNSEEAQKAIRDAAWQSLLDKHLFLSLIHIFARRGITLGVSFPVFRYYNAVTLGIDIGQRGSVTDNLIRERYFLFTLSFDLHDIWFVKTLYQ